jgi:cyclopropane-fatty-acyl-phospholipid synthase
MLLAVLIANMAWLAGGGTPRRMERVDVGRDVEDVQSHYDVGNDFYATFLTDDLRAYTRPDDTLQDAQHNKVDRIVAKLGVGDAGSGAGSGERERLLDVGVGWARGGLRGRRDGRGRVRRHALGCAEDVHRRRGAWRRGHVARALPRARRADFHRIFSIGMLEHVGCPAYDDFFACMRDLLVPDGPRRLVLHAITSGDGVRKDVEGCNVASRSFISEYILLGGQIPRREQVLEAAAHAGFKLTHLKVFGGHHYAKTLRAWRTNLLDTVPRLVVFCLFGRCLGIPMERRLNRGLTRTPRSL